MNDPFSPLLEIFHSKQSFVITSHVNPDADAIGSEVALAMYLQNKGKNIVIVNQSETPEHLRFLTKHFPVKTYNGSLDLVILEAECFCVVDTNSPKRFSALSETVRKSPAVKVCIDHHLDAEPFADLYVIDSEVPAACELLYRIFTSDHPDTITAPIAEALYAGIMTDTGSFKFPKTDEETHRITADLLRRGADPYTVYQQVYESGDVGKLHLLGRSLNSIEVHHHGTIATMILPRSVFTETGTVEADVDNFTQHVLAIKNVVIGLVFVELADGVKVSFRSKGEIAVHTVAQQFGGGGHKNASGARLKNCTLSEAVNAVLHKTKEIIA